MKKDNISIIENLKFLMQYAKEYKASFFNFYIGMLLTAIVDMASPVLLGLLIDEVLYYKNTDNFLKLALMYTVVILYQCLNHFVTYHNQHYLNSVYVLKVRHDLFKRVAESKASFLSNIKSGELATVIDEYTDYCLHFIVRNFIHFLNNIIVLLWCTFYIYQINVIFGVCVSIVVMIQVFCMLHHNKKIKSISSEQQEFYGNHLGILMSILENLRDIQLLSVGSHIIEKCKANYYKYKEKENAVIFRKFCATELIEFLNLVLLLLIYGMSAILIYHDQIQLGTFLVIITYYNTLKNKMFFTTRSFHMMGENASKIDSIRRIFMEDTEETGRGKKNCDLKGDIEFKNVSFSYGEKPVLKQVNCYVSSGRKLGIAGASGCGKSTLIALMLGFYQADEGVIKINQNDIREIELNCLRKNIGAVHQEILIYNDTIRNNLLLAKPDATEAELRTALKAASLDAFVKGLPEGLDTVIAPKGRNISGGQLQRIAIARLFLKGSNIIVCDEATSALDMHTEEDILTSVLSAFHEKTVITISHRLNTLMKCEEVIVLKDGEIVQYGEPQKLMKESGEFRELFISQISEKNTINQYKGA